MVAKQVIELARKRETFLKAQAVFLAKAIFDVRLRNGVVSRAFQMHEALVQELSSRLPADLETTDINAVARIAEMMLDGLMIALLMRDSPKRIAELKRIWMRFVDLLLPRLDEK